MSAVPEVKKKMTLSDEEGDLSVLFLLGILVEYFILMLIYSSQYQIALWNFVLVALTLQMSNVIDQKQK